MSDFFSISGGAYSPIQSLLNNYAGVGKSGFNSVSNLAKAQQSKAGASADTRSFLMSVKDISNKLRDAANSLTAGYPPLFQRMTAAVSDKEALSVKSAAQGMLKPGAAATELNIKQVATGQKNTGASMTAADKDFAVGSSSFSVNVGGKSKTFSVNVTATDTNRSAQQKMADAINKSGVGLSAKVTYDEATKKSALTVETSAVGAKSTFSIQDENGGTLVGRSGVGNVTTQAQDAVYSVNGGSDRTSNSNDVSLGNGITVTLQKASPKVTVTPKRDATAAVNGIYDFVNNYNALMETAKGYNSAGSNKLASQLAGAVKTYSASLANSGVTADKNGYLKIDTDKLKTSVEKGTAAGTFGNGSGFVNRVSTIARNATTNTSQYAANKFSGNSYALQTGLGLLFSSIA